MYCPKCDILLHMTERAGIEVDYCPSCRGVWLDEGELDTITHRLAQRFDVEEKVQSPAPTPKRKRKYRREDNDWDDDERKSSRKKHVVKRTLKELADIFD